MTKIMKDEDILRINRMQADELGNLKAQLREGGLKYAKMECDLLIARQKHKGLLKEFRAFKDLIRHLGTIGTEIEWQDHEPLP